MNCPEFADPELETLYAKIDLLTQERDDARTECEHYRKLWEHTEKRMHSMDTQILASMASSPKKRKRSIHDWIWTGIFITAASAVVYVLGWVLIWPKE